MTILLFGGPEPPRGGIQDLMGTFGNAEEAKATFDKQSDEQGMEKLAWGQIVDAEGPTLLWMFQYEPRLVGVWKEANPPKDLRRPSVGSTGRRKKERS